MTTAAVLLDASDPNSAIYAFDGEPVGVDSSAPYRYDRRNDADPLWGRSVERYP